MQSGVAAPISGCLQHVAVLDRAVPLLSDGAADARIS